MKLLMVNDERLVAESMKVDIPWDSYGIDEVFLAFSAVEARQVLSMESVDILLLDIEMPGENGISLLRWVRAQGMNCECIFLTCHANFEYAKEAVKLGCQDYILMPARSEEVGESVQKVVARILDNKDARRLQEYGRQWVDRQKEDVLQQQCGSRKSRAEMVFIAWTYIMSNLCSESLTVNDVATHCCLAPIYMSRIFKQEMGVSMSQFIIQERMVLAKQLLEEKGGSAKVVAEKVGYPSYPHFSTMFKKHFGYSPSKYAMAKNK